jgi:arylsulfatase A-like enzyme
VEFLDIYPTVAALAGLKDVPSTLHGVSLMPLLNKPTVAWNRPSVTQVNRLQIMGYSIRTERHRYTMWKRGEEGEELYDYAQDPREYKNLAKDPAAAAVKAQLRDMLLKIVEKRKS